MKKVISSVLLVLVLVSSAFAIPAPTSAKEFGSINLNKVHNLGKTGNTKIEKISYDQYVTKYPNQGVSLRKKFKNLLQIYQRNNLVQLQQNTVCIK